MPVQTIDTPEATITIETRPTGDGTGQAQTVTIEPKPGSAAANADTLRQQITNAIQSFENADANWATMTGAQRNDVLKLAVRSLARLGRIINNQLDAT